MGCASSKEEVEAVSAGPVAGRKKQFIESGTPNHGAPKQSESPKYVKSVSGRRRALLVGCNYPGNKYELHGCIRDVKMIKQILEFQYQYEDILLLVDDGSTVASPTGAVLKDALGSLLRAGEPGDSILMYYSGHGTQGVDPNSKDPYQPGVQDEAIVPTDFNLIYNEDLRALVNENLQPGVKFTLIADSCHSGNLLLQESAGYVEGPTKAIGRFLPPSAILDVLSKQHGFTASSAPLATHLIRIFKEAASNHSKRNCSDHVYEVSKHTGAAGEDLEIILLSGCRENETSEELPGPNGATNGALTSAILDITSRANTNISNQDVFVRASQIIAARKIVQHPTLEVNRKEDALTLFLLPDNSQMESYVPQ